MLANPKWFKRRRYGGWGSSPKTWQGWAYLAFILVPFMVFQAIPIWSTQTRLYVTAGWLAFVMIDGYHIMASLKRDELEEKIEAISERNAAWAMVLVLVLGIFYQIMNSALQESIYVDPFLVTALFSGMIIKTISNIYLEKGGVR